MAAQYIPIKRISSLDTPIKAEKLDGSLFTTENQAHEFIVSVRKNGVKQTVTGSVSGKFIRANGTTIFLQGSIVDGDAVVRLHQDCYNVQGRFTFNIFNTQSGVTTCIYSAVGKIDMGSTETVIDAGDVVPDISDVVAKQEEMTQVIADARTATTAANTAATNVGSIVARPYSPPYKAGEYCTQNGIVYKAKQDIPSDEEWTASHWTQTVVGNELTGLKSALSNKVNLDTFKYVTGNLPLQIVDGYYYILNEETVNGMTKGTVHNRCCMSPCAEGNSFYVLSHGRDITRAWAFANSNGDIISRANANITYDGFVTAPANSAYFYSNCTGVQYDYAVIQCNSLLVNDVKANRRDIDLLTKQGGIAIVDRASFTYNNTLINSNTGESDYSTSYVWSATDYIDISDWKQLLVSMETFPSSVIAHAGMAFYNSQKVYISGVESPVTGAAELENVYIDVPDNAVYARFCNRNVNLDEATVIVGVMIDYESLHSKVDEMYPIVMGFVKKADFNLSVNGYVKYTDGSFVSTSAYKRSDYYNIEGAKRLKLMAPILNSNVSNAGIAFYNEQKAFISGVSYLIDTTTTNATTEMVVDVPENAVYVITAYRSSQIDEFYFAVQTTDFNAEEAYYELKEEIESLQAVTPTPVLFDIQTPAQPSGTGINNKIIINSAIDAANVNVSVRVNVTDENSIIFLGSLDHRGAQHASHVQYDFENKKIKIYSKGTGSTIPSTVSYEIDFSATYDGSSYILGIGRENRDLYASITNPKTGATTKYVVLETVSGGYAYPCGWLQDKLTYGIISGSASFTRVTTTTKVSPFCVFIGDSITEGYGISYADSWSYKVANLFGNCLCMGRSGGTIDTSIMQVDDIVSKIHPNYVVVEIGTNGGNTASKLTSLVNKIKNAGATPILCHIPMMTSTSNTQSINAMIDEQNTLVVHFDNATAIDKVPSNGQNTALFQSDHLHPNVNGADAMYNQFIAEMGWIKVS